MSSRRRSRSPGPYRQRQYTPPRSFDHDRPPPPPHQYDDRRGSGPPPPPRRYDDDRPPPPRRYDDERRRYEDGRAPPRGHDDYDDYDARGPPRGYDSRRRGSFDDRRGFDDRRDFDERDRRDFDHRDRRGPRDERWERGADPAELDRDSRRGPSEPSRDVIFLGLDPQLTDNELAGFLRSQFRVNVESAKIVRDRASGVSKLFGFVQFSTLREAEHFVRDHYPTISMPALYAHSEPKNVKIDFAGSRDDARPRGPPPPPIGFPARAHDGLRDMGPPNPEQRVLLLRNLDPGTLGSDVKRRLGEEIARMIGKNATDDEVEATMTRIVMIVDRSSTYSWGFAFVEFITAELTAALLQFLNSPQHQPNGFIISQAPISTSYSNPSAFIPTPAGPLGGQFLVRAAAGGGIGSASINHPDGEFCGYWHQQAGAVETIPRLAPSIPARGAPVELSADTRAYLGNLAGPTNPEEAKPAQQQPPPPPPAAGSYTIQPIKIGLGGNAPKKAKKKPADDDGMVTVYQRNMLDDGEEVDLIGKDSVLGSRTKGHIWIPPTSTSRKVASNISKWNTKQTELSTTEAAAAAAAGPHAPPKGISSVNTIAVRPQAKSASAPAAASADNDADGFDYTDTSKLAATGRVSCLLCQRQFKTEELLRKHVAQSDLHKARIIFLLTWTRVT